MNDNNTPKISVIMSVYKEPLDWIKQSIDSILQQTFRDFEFIIICDNPENTEAIALLRDYEMQDVRIKLLFNEQNIGLTKSLNRGLSIAKGDYIARMDADDISRKDRFAIQYKYMQEHPEVDVCGSWCRLFGNHHFLSMRIKKMPQNNNEIIAGLLFENPIIHPTVMFKKNINKKIVRYNEAAIRSQDYRLWFDLSLEKAYFHNINKCLVNYRVSANQISTKYSSIQRETSGALRSKLLRTINPHITDEEVIIHNDLITTNTSGFSLEQKMSYLLNLNKWINNNCLSDIYRKLCAKYALQTCLLYRKPSYILKIPYLKFNDLFDMTVVRELVRSLIH